MGNCHLKQDIDTPTSLSKSTFDFIKPIGQGAAGKVWQVLDKSSKRQLAIKVFTKSEICSKISLNSILRERLILSMLSNPFLINMRLAFQDKEKLYLGLDLKLGGDLRFHMLKKRFSETETKFILGCLLMALDYIHAHNIVHKDIKPENIVLDSDGYAYVTDFGIACVYKEENSHENSGTPGYMAPEVICRQKYSFVADYFAVGVILFECIFGERPYGGKNRQEIRDAIVEKQVRIERDDVPEGWSWAAADFCNGLIQVKPSQRLGWNGKEDFISHEWFKEFDFEALKRFELKAPFVPSKKQDFSVRLDRYHQRTNSKSIIRSEDFSGYFFSPSWEDY